MNIKLTLSQNVETKLTGKTNKRVNNIKFWQGCGATETHDHAPVCVWGGGGKTQLNYFWKLLGKWTKLKNTNMFGPKIPLRGICPTERHKQVFTDMNKNVDG